jgi:hypothetical protein
MPIASSELLFCLSGGAANSTPANSIGGLKSNTTITDGTLNNLWDDVSAAEASAGDIEYRGIFLMNTNTTLTLSNARVWISATTSAPGDEWAITTDSANTNTANSMSSATDESTTASGQLGAWVTYGTTISLGAIGPTKSWGLWIRRSVSAAATSYASNSASITWDGETA